MLTKSQIKHLKKLTHDLKPVVMLGQHGLTEAVLNELDIALDHHELVKIKLAAGDRDDRQQLISEICKSSQAELVQAIGKMATVFRRNRKKPVIDLPKG